MTDSERQKVMKKITSLISRGGTNKRACDKAGITVECLWHWRKKGEKDETKNQQYSNFLKSFTRACEMRRESLYDRLSDAGIGEDGDWRATEAYLKLDFQREQARPPAKTGDDLPELTDEEKNIVDQI